MQLKIRHDVQGQLILPLNYHHILQSIIYQGLPAAYGYSRQMHEEGYGSGTRRFKLFTFSLIRGHYEIAGRKIMFRGDVSWEVRSPDIYMMQLLAEGIKRYGIDYGSQHFEDVAVRLSDDTVEADALNICMRSPICLYSTDPETGKTCFYAPDDEEFGLRLNENFYRKYQACYGVEPESGIGIEPVRVSRRDKYVTRYKNFYISGWLGRYRLSGERKYLDFLYQTGLGSRNSQGFGMFDMQPVGAGRRVNKSEQDETDRLKENEHVCQLFKSSGRDVE